MEPQKKLFEDPKAKTQEYLEQHKLAELMEVWQRASTFQQSCLACS